MSLILSPVDTFCVALPTYQGIANIGFNLIVIADWLSKSVYYWPSTFSHHTSIGVQNRFAFIAGGLLLWLYPAVFVWPWLPVKYVFTWIQPLYAKLLGWLAGILAIRALLIWSEMGGGLKLFEV